MICFSYHSFQSNHGLVNDSVSLKGHSVKNSMITHNLWGNVL